MTTWNTPNPGWRSRQEAIDAEMREALTHALDRMEKSLQKLRDVEKYATPMTKQLLQQHIETIEKNIARAESEFLRSESEKIVQDAYQIMSECDDSRHENNPADTA